MERRGNPSSVLFTGQTQNSKTVHYTTPAAADVFFSKEPDAPSNSFCFNEIFLHKK